MNTPVFVKLEWLELRVHWQAEDSYEPFDPPRFLHVNLSQIASFRPGQGSDTPATLWLTQGGSIPVVSVQPILDALTTPTDVVQIDQLNRRITALEERIQALINVANERYASQA